MAGRLEGLEDATDLGIQESNGCVVVGEVLTYDRRCPGPGSEALIATGQVAVVERMLRQVVGRQRQLGRIVTLMVFLRCQPRVVRRVEGHVTEKLPLALQL